MLSLALKIEIIVGIILLFVSVIVFLACLFGPCPLNKWVFKRKYYFIDSFYKSKNKVPLSKDNEGQEFDYSRVSETQTEHDLILESMTRHAESKGAAEQTDTYERFWEKPAEIRKAPPVRLNATIHLDGSVLTDGRILTVKIRSATDTPGPLLGLWHNNVTKLQLVHVDYEARRKLLISEAHTSIVSKTSNPEFNESLHIQIPQDENLNELVLCIFCCDFDKYARVVVVGELSIKLGQFIGGSSRIIQIQDLPMDPPELNNNNGEILIALHHMATSEQVRLILLKAKHLKSPDGRTVDPYITVVVIKDHEVKFRRRTGVMPNSENPVFNEIVNLYLDDDLMKEAVVVISVMHCHLKRQIRQDMDQCIGRLCLGAPCYGSGQPHWLEMLAKPRKSIAYWHKLTLLIGHSIVMLHLFNTWCITLYKLYSYSTY